MKQFIKTDEGLTSAAYPKIRVYKTIEEAEAAVANGELEDGELVTTEFTDGAVDLGQGLNVVSDAIRLIQEKIPDTAGVTNKLATHDDVQAIWDVIPEDTDKLTDNILVNDNGMADYVEEYFDTNFKRMMDIIEPVGTIKAINGSTYDTEHWHICNGQDGTPDLRGRVLEQAGASKTYRKEGDAANTTGETGLGESITSGLPNITGSVNSVRLSRSKSQSGAMYYSIDEGNTDDMYYSSDEGNTDGWSDDMYSSDEGNTDGWSDASGSNVAGIYLNASRSSNVYGRSDTVQPSAFTVNFIIKIKGYSEA